MTAAICVTMVLSLSGAASATEVPATPTPLPIPMGSPFGPGYDPTLGPPQEPETKGPGIVEAAVVAAGVADIEERRALEDASALFGVVLDIRIEAGSTTPFLDASSVVASLSESESVPVLALCLPTADAPLEFFYRPGATTAAWNVAIGDRAWRCGGRTARMVLQVGSGGLKLSVAEKAQAWKGPLVLLFDTGGKKPQGLAVAGRKVDLAEAAASAESDAGGDAAN